MSENNTTIETPTTPVIPVDSVDSVDNVDEEITQEEKDEMIKTLTHYRNVALSFINANKKHT